MGDIAFRPAGDDDEAFVFDSWLKTLRPEYPDVRDTDYYAWMRAKVQAALVEGAWILVAHPAGEPTVIWGWIAFSADAVLMVYVRPAHRQRGLATSMVRKMFPEGEVKIRALTVYGRAIRRSHPNQLRYVPL